jgi:serine/threonine-protein kinase RsbW
VTEQHDKLREGNLSISEKGEVPAVRDEIVNSLAELGYHQQDVFAICLSTNEALLNAIEHGNQCDKKKKVTVAYFIDREKAEITVTDEGLGFDPNAIPDCTADENLCKTCGRGIALMRGFMDAVEFGGNGNSVKLVKYKSSARPVPADQAQTLVE